MEVRNVHVIHVTSLLHKKKIQRRHKQSVHEVKKCPGDTCDFLTTQKAILKRHKQSVHEGKKYPCETCDFIATQKGNLWTHK